MLAHRSGILLATLLLLIAVPAAHATRGGPPTYPKTATYAYKTAQFTAAQRESLSWFDLVTCHESPERIADMRQRNPHQRIFWRDMPQTFAGWVEESPAEWWVPDTTWSLISLCAFYAMQNDWYLYDIFGERIEEWEGYAANWTRYCPLGTYGTSVGMTYAEWYVNVALPQIAYHSPDWERWGWGSSAYDGIAWEILVDCPACCRPDLYKYADPDRDGEPEGIDGTCWDAPWDDPDSLTVLFGEMNDRIWPDLQRVLDDDLVLNINRGGRYLNPSWAWELNGLKLEGWKADPTDPVNTWWDWMYGRHGPDSDPGQDGYQFAERYMHRSGIDALDGWDTTWIMLVTRGYNWPPSFRDRMQRLGLGTSLLGDGYFIYTEDEHYPYWFDLLDTDFGVALGEYQRELIEGDTLYVRRFSKGFVEVNPNTRVRGGVAAQDARFSFWLTIDDLAVESVTASSITVAWTVPAGTYNQVEATEVRAALEPLTPANWAAAIPLAGGPLSGAPGERLTATLNGLAPATGYYLAARNTVHGRLEPDLSPQVTATTGGTPPPPPDMIPPAAIADLHAVQRGETWVTLGWTAPGDDGWAGVADHYRLRTLHGEEIATEADWGRANPVAGSLPEPSAAGGQEQFVVTGLDPGASYGVAVRAVDEADWIGALSNPLLVETDGGIPIEPPADSLAPAPIEDLEVVVLEATGVQLRWSCPGDDGQQGRADHFVLGWSTSGALTSEAAWAEAETLAAGLPAPEPAGTPVTFWLGELTPETSYSVGVRAYDEAGLRSPLGPPAAVLTPPLPDTIPPGRVADLGAEVVGEQGIRLSWTAAGDDGQAGTAVRLILATRCDQMIESEADWVASLRDTFPDPIAGGAPDTLWLNDRAPGMAWGFALRYEDEAGHRGAISNFASCFLPAVPEPDSLAPAAILDLRVTALGTAALTLGWSPSGDDSLEGTAAGYLIGVLDGQRWAGGAWEQARREALEAPRAGAAPACSATVTDLVPGGAYALAVRAYDEAGNLAPLSNTLWIPDLFPRAILPPAAIPDLSVGPRAVDWVELTWSAPGDQVGEACYAYEIGLSTEPFDAEAWPGLVRSPGPAAPAAPGLPEVWRLDGLAEATAYWIALRGRDGLGHWSPLAGPVCATTHARDAIAPLPPSGLAAGLEEGGRRVCLAWEPVVEEDLLGYHVYGRPATSSQAQRLTTGACPRPAWCFATPSRQTNFFVAVTAVDASGNESVLSAERPLFGEVLALEGPFPHPIEEEARFALTVPLRGVGGEHVRARIYSVAGVAVRRWLDETLPAGTPVSLSWDARDDHGRRVAPGLYFLRLEAGGESLMRKLYVRR